MDVFFKAVQESAARERLELMDDKSMDAKRIDCRIYASWGSVLCGAIGILLTIAIYVHVDFIEVNTKSAWEARYFLAVIPLSLLGIGLGIVGRETPRAAGLVISSLILLRAIGAALTE